MRTRLCVLAVLAACAAPRPQPPAGAVVLTIDGEVENAPFRFGREDLPRLPRRAFEASPPFGPDRKGVRFEGVSLAALLGDKMELKHDADVAVVHGADGVAVPVSLPLIRQLKPVLAQSAAGGDVGGWRPGAAPLQLAWPNLDQPGIDTDPRMRWWWVGGVSHIAVESWTRTYGKALRVPPGAGDPARLGSDVLASSCIGCHQVRGVGGTRGPALGGDEAVARREPGKLRSHLRDVSGMPGAPDITPEEATQVSAFLEAVRIAGKDDDFDFTPLPPPHDDRPGTRPPGIRP